MIGIFGFDLFGSAVSIGSAALSMQQTIVASNAQSNAAHALAQQYVMVRPSLQGLVRIRDDEGPSPRTLPTQVHRPNWVAIEDAKDAELHAWIVGLNLPSKGGDGSDD